MTRALQFAAIRNATLRYRPDTMTEQAPNYSHAAAARPPAYIGPLIADDRRALRYAVAMLVVFVTGAIRWALEPILGSHAPLLPFVLTIFVCAYLAGRGPAVFASLLTAVLATVWFTNWPHDGPPAQWLAHVTFFVLISLLAAAMMHELQRTWQAQNFAVHAAAESSRQSAESAAQLRLVADAIPALIGYVNREERYLFANKMYESWFGASPDTMVGRYFKDVVGPAAYDMLRPRVERALAGERVFFEGEIPYGTGTREVSVHYAPDIDAAGTVRGFFAFVEDVAPRKRAERALREADRRKDEFLAMLAHELRNPLTPIRNVAHILSRSPPDAETLRRSCELLERQASHLAHLVEDLLDVARITRGRIVLKIEAASVESIVEMALESVEPILDARHQTVAVARPKHSVMVNADKVRLCQVVTNLLTNASKYSGEHSRIEVCIEGTQEEACIVVRDHGAGIDQQLLPDIFEPFSQGDRTLDRAQGGLGIGLTIVKHLVEMHGGRVSASSAGLAKGSEFRVWLPRARALAEQERRDLPHPRAPTPQKRVLIVEDNPDSAETLRQLMKLEGHIAEVAHDGASALTRLDEFPADVVLLDVGLPRMDGYMVAHAIRARFESARLRPRLIALTGYGREEDRNAALRSGFDDHLTKPVDPRRLLALVAEPATVTSPLG